MDLFTKRNTVPLCPPNHTHTYAHIILVSNFLIYSLICFIFIRILVLATEKKPFVCNVMSLFIYAGYTVHFTTLNKILEKK